MFNNPGVLPPAKNEAERQIIIQTASKQTSGYNNPCLKEQKLSYKCLTDNNFVKDKCSASFANYSACQEFWNKIKACRRSEGIRPYLPLPEDRERIKQEHMERMHRKQGSSRNSTYHLEVVRKLRNLVERNVYSKTDNLYIVKDHPDI